MTAPSLLSSVFILLSANEGFLKAPCGRAETSDCSCCSLFRINSWLEEVVLAIKAEMNDRFKVKTRISMVSFRARVLIVLSCFPSR